MRALLDAQCRGVTLDLSAKLAFISSLSETKADVLPPLGPLTARHARRRSVASTGRAAFFISLLVLLLSSVALASQKEGKVRIHVTAGEPQVYKGVQQQASELEDSARDLRRHLGKAKWLELSENVEEADIRLRVLGRGKDPDRGNVLGYSLDAGAYKTEDEFAYIGESEETGGGRGLNTSFTPRQVLGWGELARRFAQSLDGFAESNYERIVSQRENK